MSLDWSTYLKYTAHGKHHFERNLGQRLPSHGLSFSCQQSGIPRSTTGGAMPSLSGGNHANEDPLKQLLALVETDKTGRLKIPPERLVAERLGVQRAKVRELLLALEQFGFIERIQGSGTFLTIPRPSFMQVYFEIAMQLKLISFDAVQRAREMLEMAIVEEAAHRATEDDIKELWRLCDQITGLNNVEQKIEADFEFHRFLASVTRNAPIMILFQGMASVLFDVVRQRRMILHGDEVASQKTSINHRAIVEALEKNDPELARKAMSAHFSIWDQQYCRFAFV